MNGAQRALWIFKIYVYVEDRVWKSGIFNRPWNFVINIGIICN